MFVRIAVLVAAILALSVPAAAQTPSPERSERSSCSQFYTIKSYVAYASRVYQRSKISRRAQKRMAIMKKCQHSDQAKRWVDRFHKRFVRQREWRFRGRFRGRFVATAYGPPWGGIEGGAITATGMKLPGYVTGRPLYVIAVDPNMVPLNSRVHIWPNPYKYKGCWRAKDTGGAIVGARIDFLVMTGRAHQNAWGRRSVKVYSCRN